MSDFATFDAHEGETPAAPTSGLASLRKQREQIKASLHLDLLVPRYDEPVYVRYTAPTKAQINRINDRAKKSRDKDALAEAALLAECAVGVFQKDDAGKPIGQPEQWPKFDKDLAEYLGEPKLERAVDVVRALFFTDGDIIAQAAALGRWAGFAEEQAVEEYEGN
ncbi:hypothetical protein N8K70_03945 [Microbacterium betulae]|uniref:Uncharacterized protein n=1 Tax=Microbacterium betulae TaxID=2981139 RepID=A0AA97FIG9_9MICO|nr:hypothetical protein [Microbacterium sp. AB]WOF23843.1 hypothetical protein N8K70_03945 [Microbacterium sp. AB]